MVAGDLNLWVSEHDRAPGAEILSIKQHNDVVESATTETMTPVPLRFGQWVSAEQDARAVLLTSHKKWLELLSRFAGATEFGIRVFDPAQSAEPDAAPRGTGTAYMRALASRQNAGAETRAQVLAALHDALAGVVIDERSEPLRTAHGVLSVAYLVHRSHMNAYNERVDKVRGGLGALRLLSTGPWPPYSFVT